jgi:hypothetical protein
MKLGVQNYALLIAAENSCIDFSSNRINSLQTLHKITEFYTKWFRVCTNLTSKFRTDAIFKSYVKENND